MSGALLPKRIWTGLLIGALLMGTACEQDRPNLLESGEGVQLELQFAYRGPQPKLAAEAVRVFVWHVKNLPGPEPAGKTAQLPDIDFWMENDPNDWLAWAHYWRQQLEFENVPERSTSLRIEGGVARGSLRVLAGVKHLFVGRFRGVELTHIGSARIEALPVRVNQAVVELEPFVLPPPLEFASAALEGRVRDAVGKAAGSLLASDVAGLLSLSAAERQIDDLSGVEQLTGLRELKLGGNQISDLTPLTNLGGLLRLDLSGNRISDVRPLGQLTRLTWLNLANNLLTDVTELAKLKELKELDLSGNQIGDLTPLAALKGLLRLDVRGNPIDNEVLAEQVEALEGLEIVVLFDPPEVEISEVEIPEIAPGEFADPQLFIAVADALRKNILLPRDFAKLKKLSISGQGIGDLNGLQHLTRMTSLGLDGNEISDLTPLAAMVELDDLDLSNNAITDIAPLVANPGLGEGDRVDLRGNPLSEEAKNIQIPALEERGVEVLYDEE